MLLLSLRYNYFVANECPVCLSVFSRDADSRVTSLLPLVHQTFVRLVSQQRKNRLRQPDMMSAYGDRYFDAQYSFDSWITATRESRRRVECDLQFFPAL